MAKYRGLFLLISVVMWAGILYGVSKVRPEMVTDFLDNVTVVKAVKEKKPPPPPPPPPPPEKLPPPPKLVERKAKIELDLPPPPPEERTVAEKPPPPPRPQPERPPSDEPVVPTCPNPAFKQATGGGAINVSYDPPPGAGNGRASAVVQVDANGRASSVSLTNPSGNSQFDASFQAAARSGNYEPALKDCFATAGQVTVTASFSAAELPQPKAPPACQEAPSAARKLRPFNIERAYPQRAIDRGQEGSVSATLQISESGDVVGVVITAENPPGVFGTAVDREARRMKYSPARRECANVSDSVPLQVQFKLGE